MAFKSPFHFYFPWGLDATIPPPPFQRTFFWWLFGGRDTQETTRGWCGVPLSSSSSSSMKKKKKKKKVSRLLLEATYCLLPVCSCWPFLSNKKFLLRVCVWARGEDPHLFLWIGSQQSSNNSERKISFTFPPIGLTRLARSRHTHTHTQNVELYDGNE